MLTNRMLKALAAVCWLTCTGSTVSFACNGIGGTSFFPVCSVPVAEPDEELIVVETSGAWKRRPTITIGHRYNNGLSVVDLEVKTSEKPLYVVLSSDWPVLWRFTGETANVSRVIVFGSTRVGAEFTSIVGIGREKIVFPDIDRKTYAQGQAWFDSTGKTMKVSPSSCDWHAKACHPDNYFFRFPSSGSDRKAVVKRRIGPLYSAVGFIPNITNNQVPADTTGFDVVSAGPLPANYFDMPTKLTDHSPIHPKSPISMLPSERHDQTKNRPIEIDPNVVVFPDERP